MSLIRRASTLEVSLEQLEGALSQGQAADLATYAAASGHLRRILQVLGLEKRAPPTPTLAQYLEAKYGDGAKNAAANAVEIER